MDEDERLNDSTKEKNEELNRINEGKEAKIFDVSRSKLNAPSCWPSCSPCSPDGDCSPSVVCNPDISDSWRDCKPCGPTGHDCSPDWNTVQKSDDNCWPSCSPCSPDDSCGPDYSDSGK